MQEMMVIFDLMSKLEKIIEEEGYGNIRSIQLKVGAETLLILEELQRAFDFIRKPPYQDAILEIELTQGSLIQLVGIDGDYYS